MATAPRYVRGRDRTTAIGIGTDAKIKASTGDSGTPSIRNPT